MSPHRSFVIQRASQRSAANVKVCRTVPPAAVPRVSPKSRKVQK